MRMTTTLVLLALLAPALGHAGQALSFQGLLARVRAVVKQTRTEQAREGQDRLIREIDRVSGEAAESIVESQRLREELLQAYRDACRGGTLDLGTRAYRLAREVRALQGRIEVNALQTEWLGRVAGPGSPELAEAAIALHGVSVHLLQDAAELVKAGWLAQEGLRRIGLRVPGERIRKGAKRSYQAALRLNVAAGVLKREIR